MITEIKRRNVDPGLDQIALLDKTIKAKARPNKQLDLKGKPKLNYDPIFNEPEEPGLVGKFKLNAYPGYRKKSNSGKIRLNTDFLELADSAEGKQLVAKRVYALPYVKPDSPKPVRSEKRESAKEKPTGSESDADETFDAKPSDAEPNSSEPTAGEEIPDEPTSDSPTDAKIIEAPAPAEPVDDISNDSDDSDIPDDEDRNPPRVRPKRSRILCTFFTFWSLNALVCFMIYGFAFPGVYRAIVEPQPNHYPLLLVPREKWSIHDEDLSTDRTTFKAKRVTIVQTDTRECKDYDDCLNLLDDLEREGILPYNFLISSTGDVFEAYGWNQASPMFPEMPTMVVAFIGDYDKKEPSVAQLTQLKILLSTSEHIEYLDSSYKINGRKIKKLPTKLFQMLKVWKKYDYSNSDSEYVSVDFDPEVLDKD